MLPLPVFMPILFVATTLLTLWMFYKAAHQSFTVLMVSLGWLVLQAFISLSGFYTVTNTFPPRFILLLGPPMVCILVLVLTKKGKSFIRQLDAKRLTYLHTIRIPVEMVLFGLYFYGFIPQLMTFEGRNFDILSGISAPFIAYWGYTRKKFSKTILIGWNLICMGLLFNIVIHAILAAPTSFQQFGFTQPNIAILYFPFIWLPSFVVPVVFLSHLASLLQLIRNRS